MVCSHVCACVHSTSTCTTLRPHHCVNRFFKHFEHCLPVINKTNTCRIICVIWPIHMVCILYPQFNTCSSTNTIRFFSLFSTNSPNIFESHRIESAMQSHSTATATMLSKHVDSYNNILDRSKNVLYTASTQINPFPWGSPNEWTKMIIVPVNRECISIFDTMIILMHSILLTTIFPKIEN